jgi:hypothetical protein
MTVDAAAFVMTVVVGFLVGHAGHRSLGAARAISANRAAAEADRMRTSLTPIRPWG